VPIRINDLEAIPARSPSRVAGLAMSVRDRYRGLIGRAWFRSAIVWVFALWAVLSSITVFELVFSVGVDIGDARRHFGSDAFGDLSFINIASLYTSAVSAVLVFLGVRDWREGKRLDAYRYFDRALLVSIFLTRVFSFVESQFGAVFGVALDLLLLTTIRYAAQQEKRIEREPAPAPATATTEHAPAAI
jgi:hypothetical protein